MKHRMGRSIGWKREPRILGLQAPQGKESGNDARSCDNGIEHVTKEGIVADTQEVDDASLGEEAKRKFDILLVYKVVFQIQDPPMELEPMEHQSLESAVRPRTEAFCDDGGQAREAQGLLEGKALVPL